MSEIDQSFIESQLRRESPETATELDEMEQQKTIEQSFGDNIQEPRPYTNNTSAAQRRLNRSFIQLPGGRWKKRPHDIDAGDVRGRPDGWNIRRANENKIVLEEDQDFFEEFAADERISSNEVKAFLKELLKDITIGLPRNWEAVTAYSRNEDKLVRLNLLTTMNIYDVVDVILAQKNKGSAYLLKRLAHYFSLRKNSERDPESGISPESIATGILRDAMYAEMLGTPELGALLLARKKIRKTLDHIESENRMRKHRPFILGVPPTHGTESGIAYGHASIGYYPIIRKIYEDASRVAAKNPRVETTREAIEHAGVLLASDWYVKASEYNDPWRSMRSPYYGSFQEAIDWAQLGGKVRNQLRGMRQKIRGVDLREIGRFKGVSGESRKLSIRKRAILEDLESFQGMYWDNDTRREAVARKNKEEIAHETTLYHRELYKLDTALHNKRIATRQIQLSDEEERFQLESIEEDHQRKAHALHERYHARVEYLEQRTHAQLISDLQQKRAEIETMLGKKQSIAESAINLYFELRRDEETEPLIDWINDAPVGTIKRARKALQRGVDKVTVQAMAACEMIYSKEYGREELEKMKRAIENAHPYNERLEFEALRDKIAMAAMLSKRGYKLTAEEIEELSKQITNKALSRALAQFTLDEVKEMMSRGVQPANVAGAIEILERRGIYLQKEDLEKLALMYDEKNRKVFETAVTVFSISELMKIQYSNIELVSAVELREAFVANNYKMPVSKIIELAPYATAIQFPVGFYYGKTHVSDFGNSLKHLSLPEAEVLLKRRTTYREFEAFRKVAEEFGFSFTFEQLVFYAQQKVSTDKWRSLFDVFSLDEIGILIENKADMERLLSIKKLFEQKGILLSPMQIARYSRVSNSSDIEDGLRFFKPEEMQQLLDEMIAPIKAVQIRERLKADFNKLNTFQHIITIAGFPEGVEVVIESLNAGFSIEEIATHPILISTLVRDMS